MPRPRKPPRLWLKPEQRDQIGKVVEHPKWYIAHHGRRIATGCAEADIEAAEKMLAAYEMGSFIGSGPRPGMIYFASAALEGYPVKIGWSSSAIGDRIAMLQIGNPHTMICLGTMLGSPKDERVVHGQFAASHIRGEWFERSGELLRFIQTNCKEAPNPYIGSTNRYVGTDRDSAVSNVTKIVDFAKVG